LIANAARVFPWPRLILCLLAVAWGLRAVVRARREHSMPAAGSLLALTARQKRIQGIVVAIIGAAGAVGVVVQHLRA
jgi:hypothetical protein